MDRHRGTVLISLGYLAKKHLSTERGWFPREDAEEESGETHSIPVVGVRWIRPRLRMEQHRENLGYTRSCYTLLLSRGNHRD